MLRSREIVELMKSPTAEDAKLIRRALDFAKRAHKGVKRASGEPYITHPFAVAKILTQMNADAQTIAAGLIHDTLEDGLVTAAEIEKEFGQQILFLVEGVTKLG